jgi:hypothetical protein
MGKASTPSKHTNPIRPNRAYGSSRQAIYCTCNLTMRRIRVAPVVVEKQWVLHNVSVFVCVCVFVCSLRYPASNAHASYYHLWPNPLYNIFLHYLKYGMIFGEIKITTHKMRVLIFSTLSSDTFLILRINERDITKNVYWSSCKLPVILVLF